MAGANEGAERVVVEARVIGTPMEKAAEPALGAELSRSYKGLLINYRERRIRHMHQTLDDYIYGADR